MTDTREWAGAIRSPADVRRVLDEINRQGLTRANTTALAAAVRPAEQVEPGLDATTLLPLPQPLHGLLPWPGGLRRGATVATVGSTTLLMLLLAAATAEGWAATVGMPGFGALAAHELGVKLDRLALVPEPGPDWARVVGALMGGVDMVAVAAPGQVAEATVRALQARARESGTILVPVGPWPGADLVLEVTGRRWEGLGQGRGRLKRQYLDVQATGRGRAARPRTALFLGEPRIIWPDPPKDAHTFAQPEPVPADAHNGAQTEDLWSGLFRHVPKIERQRPWH